MELVSKAGHSVSVSAVLTRYVTINQQGRLFLIYYKLVDTKSVNNTTLLHFLERTVAKHFPDMEDFLEELAKPAEAYRGSLALQKITFFCLSFGRQSTCRISARDWVSYATALNAFAKNWANTLRIWTSPRNTGSKCGTSLERPMSS